MMILLNILAFVLVLGTIVAIHELGHLIFAKKAGILCYEYSLGFGPKIYSKKGEETDFSVRAIPLGGFVSMAGELSSDLIKDGEVIGLNLKDGKVSDIILTDKIKSEVTIKVTKHEVYDEEETGYLFVEGLVDGNLEHYEILLSANYIINEKQKLQISPYNRSFESKTYKEKLLTLLAGPFMNFFLAILLFLIVFAVQGKPQNTNVVGEVIDDLPASVLGIKEKDKIISIGGIEINKWNDLEEAYNTLDSYESVEISYIRGNVTITENVDFAVSITKLGIANYNKNGVLINETATEGAIVGTSFGNAGSAILKNDIITKVKYKDEFEMTIKNWHDLVEVSKLTDGGNLEITLLREGEEIIKTIEVWENKVLKSQGALEYNIMLGVNPTRKFSFSYSLTQPFVAVWNSFYQVIMIIGFLFGGSKQVGVADLSGPVGIFNIVGQIVSQGFLSLLSFTAFLSVNVGVLNLLPIPALDGGRIAFISYEGITRKKISQNVENTINNVFFFLLMALFIYVTINDIFRLV